jgi:hypothetical protein
LLVVLAITGREKTVKSSKEFVAVAMTAGLAFGLGAVVPAPALAKDQGQVAMNRLYNPNSGEHFYTADTNERDHLVGLGWRSEGMGWVAPKKSSTPVYRLYNPNAGDHHYTTSATERDKLVSVGWRYEGIGWYSSDAKSVPLYRQYNPNARTGTHNYTTSEGENDHLVSLGWRGEGIGWYGVAHEHVWAKRNVVVRAEWDEQVMDQEAWDEPVYEDKSTYATVADLVVRDPLGEGECHVKTEAECEALMANLEQCYRRVYFESNDSDWNEVSGYQYQNAKTKWAKDNGLPTSGKFEDPDDPDYGYYEDRWCVTAPSRKVLIESKKVQVGTIHHKASYQTIFHPAVVREETYCTICGKVKDS